LIVGSEYLDYSYWNIPGLLQPPELYCKPQTPIASPFEDETTRTYLWPSVLHSYTPSPLYDDNTSDYATLSTGLDQSPYPSAQPTPMITARDYIDLPPCWSFTNGYNSLLTTEIPERVEYLEAEPLQTWNTVSCTIPDLVRSESVESMESIERMESNQHTPPSRIREQTLNKQNQEADSASRSPRQARDDMFLYQLRVVKGLCWRDIATEFYRRTGKTARIPALQMRVGRFRKRNRLISTRSDRSVWRVTVG